MRLRFPAFVPPLDRKLLRDLAGMWGQALAIALVIAAGAAVQLLAEGMLSSLEGTRDAYYDRYRFADIWAPAVRAPVREAEALRAVPGVAAVEARVRTRAQFDIPGMDEPASGQAISLPEDGRDASVNGVFLALGRLPAPGARHEAVVLKSFAEAHGLRTGDTLATLLQGGREQLTIVGLALSPEHVYAIAPGQLVPDDRLFGVIWMDRDALGQAAGQDNAFNEAVIRLSPGASLDAVVAEVDATLAPYGGVGAYGRKEHISDAFISSELDQLRTMANLIPPIFLAVAAFLVNVVITRLIATERADIGLMKAFGYSSTAIALHYMKLVSVLAAVGLLIGAGLGQWLGRSMAELYADYYRFPFLVFEADPAVYLIVMAAVAVSVGGGALLAVMNAVRLHPAEAMRSPPPPDYSRALGQTVTGWSALDQQTRMILRQIVRWPMRAAFTMAGVAVSGALLIATLFFIDAMEEMVRIYFSVANRHDVSVTLIEPRDKSALFDLSRRPGVALAEPYRSVAVRLHGGHLNERAALTGLEPGAQLSRALDSREQPVVPPPGGLVLSRDLADKLGVEAGDMLEIEVTEGARPVVRQPVSAVVTTLIGSGAWMQRSDLNQLMREGDVVSGAYLRVDPAAEAALYRDLKDAPMVAGVGLERQAEQNFRTLMDRNIGVSIYVYTAFAGLIAAGVAYNSVRISFAERSRELASLRVLGFTRAEVSYILLGEVAFLTLLALPLAGVGGTLLAQFLASAMSSDLFRLPFLINPSTYGYAALVLVIVTAAASLLVRRRVDTLDMIAVLKTREG